MSTCASSGVYARDGDSIRLDYALPDLGAGVLEEFQSDFKLWTDWASAWTAHRKAQQTAAEKLVQNLIKEKTKRENGIKTLKDLVNKHLVGLRKDATSAAGRAKPAVERLHRDV